MPFLAALGPALAAIGGGSAAAGGLVLGATAGGTIGSALIGAHAAGQAANAQVQGANYAATLQKQESDAALAENQRQFNIGQQNLQPWLQTGSSAQVNLARLMGTLPSTPAGTSAAPSPASGGMTYVTQSDGSIQANNPDGSASSYGVGAPGYQEALQGSLSQGKAPVDLQSLVNPNLGAEGSLAQGWNQKFVAPNDITEQNDPGYQFRMQQGQQALERSAAAKGTLFSGGTGKALERYGQDYASNEYGNVYNRALGEYQQGYNQFQNNQANQFNRLSAVAGGGQVAAGQLNSAGQNSANNISNILLTTGAQQGQQANNAAAARASGYVGTANAYGGALGNIGNLVSLYSLLNKGGANQGQKDYQAVQDAGGIQYL